MEHDPGTLWRYGATHPGASAPFGMTAAVPFGFYHKPYEQGYPCGYNGHDFYGFGHFAQSGTGTIRWYYNYLLTTLQLQNELSPQRREITAEEAVPGRYSCMLSDSIACEAVRFQVILSLFRREIGRQVHCSMASKRPWVDSLKAKSWFVGMARSFLRIALLALAMKLW